MNKNALELKEPCEGTAVFIFACNWRGVYIMKHGINALLLWWIMLLNPELSPESSWTLSNVLCTILLLNLPLSLYSYLKKKILLKPEKKSEFYQFLTRKRSKKCFRPKKCQKTPDTQARISCFLIGVLGCSLHLQSQDREPKFGTCFYQRPVTI